MAKGITCPTCDKAGSTVIDSRPGDGVRHRRHRCPSCLATWATVEVNRVHLPKDQAELRSSLQLISKRAKDLGDQTLLIESAILRQALFGSVRGSE